ncbi:MAG: response regulator [Elusimicrobia bacterium]|nr:response regulator [Elusimicrobiota bacterium]
MDILFLQKLTYNICLLLGAGVLYSELNLKPARRNWHIDLLAGAILGVICLVVMLNPWILRPGLVFDVRSILLSVAGLFFPPLSAMTAAAIAAGYRLNLGGPGAAMGVAVIFTTTATGILWRRLRPHITLTPSFGELALFGLAVHLIMLGCAVLLPSELRADTLRNISLPVLVIYPVGTMVFALLLLRQGERERGRRALAESEDRYRAVSEHSHNAICVLNQAGRITWVNGKMTALAGYPKEVYLEAPSFAKFIAPESMALVTGEFAKFAAGRPYNANYRFSILHANGEKRICECSAAHFHDKAGELNLVVSLLDVTEQSRLEAQLRQTQKMDAIGSLAGGIAHDFNNILSAISGYCGLLAKSLPAGQQAGDDVKEIMKAADRGATLTRQLLAFSRRQVISPALIDLNKSISDMTKMLRRLVGSELKLSTRLFHAPCRVKADPGQMEQVVMNLVLNARDASPKDGEITIGTEVLSEGERAGACPALPPGPLVRLTVADKGCGMSEEVQCRIFEPFFTTKPAGSGTGLGLSVVFGIVKQNGAEIEVESCPGKGSVFCVYFPFMQVQTPAAGAAEAAPAGGTETILLVDDDEAMRSIGTRLLKAFGYEVLCAADGKEALELMTRRGKPADLLITDVVMPGMSGRELARELARLKLAGRTLYMSGYTDDAIMEHGVLEPGIAFLYKPFSSDGLAAKVREILDGPPGQAVP